MYLGILKSRRVVAAIATTLRLGFSGFCRSVVLWRHPDVSNKNQGGTCGSALASCETD